MKGDGDVLWALVLACALVAALDVRPVWFVVVAVLLGLDLLLGGAA